MSYINSFATSFAPTQRSEDDDGFVADRSRRALAQRAFMEAISADKPIQSHWQGIAKMAQALVAGLELRSEDERERSRNRAIDSLIGGNMAGGPPQPAAPQAPGPAARIAADPTAIGAPDESMVQAPQQPGVPALSAPVAAAPAATPQQTLNIPPAVATTARTMLRMGDRNAALGIVAPFLKPSDPEFGVIGQDVYGKNQYGWVDRRHQRLTPTSGAAPTGAPAIPPPPLGSDPSVWREGQTKNLLANSLPGTDEQAGKLRKEIQDLPSYKNLAAAAPIYQSMLATAPTNSKASDLNLVYGLGKIFDPTSVVREGEMIMVKNTASLPDWLVGAANSLNGGAALTPETRAAIMAEANNRIGAYKGIFDQDAKMYRGIAGRSRLKEADVIPQFGPFEKFFKPPPTTPPGASPPAAMPPAQPTLDDINRELRRRGVR